MAPVISREFSNITRRCKSLKAIIYGNPLFLGCESLFIEINGN